MMLVVLYWEMLMRRIFASIMWIRQLFVGLVSRLYKEEVLRVAIVGGSNSVMRKGYANYLDASISKSASRPTQLNYYSLGGTHSIYGLIQEDRHRISANNDIIFLNIVLMIDMQLKRIITH